MKARPYKEASCLYCKEKFVDNSILKSPSKEGDFYFMCFYYTKKCGNFSKKI